MMYGIKTQERGERSDLLQEAPGAVVWGFGDVLFLDLGCDYIGVSFDSSLGCTFIFCILLYMFIIFQ